MRARVSLELVVDVFWVVLSAGYVAIAQTYPPDSRLAPSVAGATALLVGLVQLLGNLHPGLGRVTHGEPRPSASVPEAVGAASPPAGLADRPSETSAADRRQLVGIAFTIGLLVGVYLLGFVVALPLFMLLYFLFLYRRGWRFAAASSAAVLVFVVLVVEVLGVHLPHGLIWDSLIG